MNLTLRPRKSGLVAKNIVSKQLTFQASPKKGSTLSTPRSSLLREATSLLPELQGCSCTFPPDWDLTHSVTNPLHKKSLLLLPALPASASRRLPSLFVVFYYANDILVEVEPFVSEVKKNDNFLSKSSSPMKFYKNRYNQRKIKFHR